MKIKKCLILMACVFLSGQCWAKDTGNFVKHVNPFIGTSGVGHTFPGATVPFGLVQLSPQTGNYVWEYTAGYQFNDVNLKGFAHTHLSGTGVADLGDLLILPFCNEAAAIDLKIPMNKSTEQARPGYYSVELVNGIKAELAASSHTGVHRYTYKKCDKKRLLINLDSTLFSWGDPAVSRVVSTSFKGEAPELITGEMESDFWVKRKVFFAIKFSEPVANLTVLKESKGRIVALDFASSSPTVELRVGISTVDVNGAKNNLAKQTETKPFDIVTKEAASTWNTYLSKIKIKGTQDQKTNFYTSMYHLFIHPNNIADVDGRFRGPDDKVRTSSFNAYYSTLSLWDTYRAAHPLYTLLVPEVNNQIVKSMLEHAKIQNQLPVWTLWGKENYCMIGNHSVPVIVDAYLKNPDAFDGDAAYSAISETLKKNGAPKYDWLVYDKYGYLPSDIVKSEAVSRTLEAGFDDWSAAQLAKALKKPDSEFDFFMKRASYYKNLFDPKTKLMRGKNSNGDWVTPFDPVKISHDGTGQGDYTEGNAWQYSWHVMHDIEGLIQLMGGKKHFGDRLDQLFSMSSEIHGDGLVVDVSGLIGQYAHGNEPSHHVAYLYNYAGRFDKTQEKISQILTTQYSPKPDGLSGNDDCGQMSAWYIFSSLGFYPVNPVSGMFDIGAPSFPYAEIQLGNKAFVIEAKNLSDKNKYVQSITLNGRRLNEPLISYREIIQGGKLVFEMGRSRKPVLH